VATSFTRRMSSLQKFLKIGKGSDRNITWTPRATDKPAGEWRCKSKAEDTITVCISQCVIQ